MTPPDQLAHPAGSVPRDYDLSNSGDERLDYARDMLARFVENARRFDEPGVLFAAGTLELLETLRERWPAAFSEVLASMRFEWKAEVLRLLRERSTAARAVEAEQAEDDWPGTGSIESFLTTPPPPRREFVRDRLPANRGVVLAGIGGSSKTRFLYHLAIGAALGRVPFPWEIQRTGFAALIPAEDTHEDAHHTTAAMVDQMGLTGDECVTLAERLRIFPLAGRPSRLLASVGGDLVETGLVERLLATLRPYTPNLVFVGIDPALAFTEGDELNQAHQRRLGELVDRLAIELDACVMLATHAGKSLQSAEEIGSHSARGGGALTDAVRAEYVLRTMTAGEARSFGIDSIEERKAHVQLVATKGNNLPPAAFAPIWLRRGPGGVLEAADLVPHAAPSIGPREVRALEILQGLAAVSAPRLGAWREACARANLLTGATDRAREKAMDRIRDSLLCAGLIEPGATRGFYVPKVAE